MLYDFVDTYSLLLLLVTLVNSYITFTVQKTVCIFMLERKTGKMASHANISIVILLDSVYPQIVKGQALCTYFTHIIKRIMR